MTEIEQALVRSMLTAHQRKLAEPWREYCPWRPGDMPPRNGSKAALKSVLADKEIKFSRVTD